MKKLGKTSNMSTVGSKMPPSVECASSTCAFHAISFVARRVRLYHQRALRAARMPSLVSVFVLRQEHQTHGSVRFGSVQTQIFEPRFRFIPVPVHSGSGSGFSNANKKPSKNPKKTLRRPRKF